MARSQQACIQLGCTLSLTARVARERGDRRLAAEANTELGQIVERVGPEIRALAWAREVATGKSHVSDRNLRTSDKALGVLTALEREVAVLLTQGFTNRQIADALVIAEGTAGVHVDHILNKLGFRSRAQVAAWAAQHGLIKASSE